MTSSEIEENFVQYNNFPMGATHHKEKIFISLPRRLPGVPATVAYILNNGARGSSPSLQAYPDFRTNELHVSKTYISQRNQIESMIDSNVTLLAAAKSAG